MLYSKIFACHYGWKKLFVFASFFLSAILFSSCGVWTDFTTYFNTYYNAKTLFDQTEEQILLQKKDIFLFRDQTQQNSPSVQYNISNNNQQTLQNPNQIVQDNPQNQNQFSQQNQNQFSQQNQNQSNPQQTNNQFAGSYSESLRKVIEKCSKILQYDKNSSFFPDALFMTGKALYYQQEYVGAQRKFKELAGLDSKKYSLINKLWLARTYLQLRDFEEGLKLIDEVKDQSLKEDNENIFTEATVVQIGFLTFRQEYLQAAVQCKDYLNVSKNDEAKALVSFELGKIYTLLSDEKNAMDAYSSVLKYSPTFEVEFRSRLETAKLLKQLNKIDESEAMLDNMRFQGRYKANLHEILVELGLIYYDKNEVQKSINIFRDVDSTYKILPAGGIADQQLAKIYRIKIRDYDSSYKYYNKVISSLAPSEMKTEAARHLKNLEKYFEFRNNLRINFKAIDYVTHPKNYIQDSVDYALAYHENQEEIRKAAETRGNANPQQQTAQTAQPVQPVLNIQQQQAIIDDYKKKGKEVPLATLIKIGRVRKPEMPRMSKDSLKKIIGQNMYDLGNHFFTELEVPDSAKIYLDKSLKDYPNKAVKVQAMFALGTVYETFNDSVEARKLFRYIYDSSSTNPLAKASAEKLGLIKRKSNSSILNQEETLASKLYVEAEKKYYEKNYSAAIDSFHNIYIKFQSTSFAPKSIYYIGMIYENEFKNYDSAAVYYGIIVKEFSKSPLLVRVSEKFNEYKAVNDEKQSALDKKIKEEKQKEKEKNPSNSLQPTEPKQFKDENMDGNKSKQPVQSELKKVKVDPDSTAVKKVELKNEKVDRDSTLTRKVEY